MQPDEKVAFSSETVEHIASLDLSSGVGVSFYTHKRKDEAVPGSPGRAAGEEIGWRAKPAFVP